MIGIFNRLYGLENLHHHLTGITMSVIGITIVIGIYLYVNTALQNLSIIQIKTVH